MSPCLRQRELEGWTDFQCHQVESGRLQKITWQGSKYFIEVDFFIYTYLFKGAAGHKTLIGIICEYRPT